MKSLFTLILLFVVLIGGLVWLFIYTGKNPNIKNPKYTIGTVVVFKQAQKSAGLDAIIEFNVEGVNYKTRIGSYANKTNVIGEKYKVKYDKKNPNQCIVLREKPVFIKEELTKFTTGEIRRFSLTNHKGKTGLVFIYKVGEKSYSKAQTIDARYKEAYPNLKKGKAYTVEYWIEDPKRAIIYLDKPVK